MSQNYEQMWTSLGLDLKSHEALLGVLGSAYQSIFMSQKNRPESMGYFDFVMSEVHGLRIRELVDARAAGRKVIGSYCVFVPEEIVVALDGVHVGLCAGAEFGFQAAEEVLPRNICSLIKSAFGFKLGKVCPYVEACDMVVGENTCDGKKKAYEILGGIIDGLYIIDLPQMKNASAKTLLKDEYKKFAAKLELLTGKKLTPENLKMGIRKVNDKRRAVNRLSALRKADPTPISGLDSLLVNQVFFYDDIDRFTGSVNKICDELETRVREKKGVFSAGTPRLVVSGCPMAVPNWKLPAVIEASGAAIVGEELCTGARGARWLVDENGGDVDKMFDNLVDRYLKIECAVFTPNGQRLDHIREMVKEYGADGVVHYNLTFCQPYQIESAPFEKQLEQAKIPVLRIETDYSQDDMGQLKTRIDAFIERIKA